MSAIYLWLVLFAAVFGTGVALYSLLHRKTPGAGPLALLLLAGALWSLSDGLSLANNATQATFFWAKLGLSITTVLPLAWFLMSVEYTGWARRLKPWHLVGLLVEPIGFTILVWTNASHGLVWSDPALVSFGQYTSITIPTGVAFWVHILYSYSLIAIGAFLLVRVVLRANDLFRSQSTALLGAISVPLVANALFLFRITPSGVDPTGVAFVATGGLITGAIFRDQLLSVAAGTREIGRDEVLTELEDAVFILEGGGTVVDCNPAAANLSGTAPPDAIGQPIETLVPALEQTLSAAGDRDQRMVTIESGGVVRRYDCRLTPLEGPYGTASGSIVSLRDVTAQTRREQQLDVLNRLLRHNVRNEMNVIRGHAELLGADLDDADRLARVERIIDTVDSVTERSDKMGALTRAFEVGDSSTISLQRVLTDAVDTVRTAYPNVMINVASRTDQEVRGTESLIVAFEELLENSIEHNNHPSPEATISVLSPEETDDSVTVRISDNGPGIDEQERLVIERGRETPLEHGSGIGLWLVAWIVRNYGGTMAFEDAGEGTTVVVTLPRGDRVHATAS